MFNIFNLFKKQTKVTEPVIFKNHHNGNRTIVIGQWCSNGCQTFHKDDLDVICRQHEVSARHKRHVLNAMSDLPVDWEMMLNLEDDRIDRIIAKGCYNNSILKKIINRHKSDDYIMDLILNRKNVELEDFIIYTVDNNILSGRIAEITDSYDNLALLARNRSSYVRIRVAERNLPTTNNILCDDTDSDVLTILIKNAAKDVNLGMLHFFATHKEIKIRRMMSIYCDKITDKDVQIKIRNSLLKENDFDITESIAWNTKDLDTLKGLTNHPDSRIRVTLANRDIFPVSRLLVNDSDDEIRFRLTNMRDKRLNILMINDPSETIRMRLLDCDAIEIACLMLEDPCELIRKRAKRLVDNHRSRYNLDLNDVRFRANIRLFKD